MSYLDKHNFAFVSLNRYGEEPQAGAHLGERSHGNAGLDDNSKGHVRITGAERGTYFPAGDWPCSSPGN